MFDREVQLKDCLVVVLLVDSSYGEQWASVPIRRTISRLS